MSGLNIGAFLKHGEGGGGGRGKWLREWRKNGKGSITVWLHVLAPIVPVFGHQFMLEDTYEDKETKKKVPTLKFLRFVSMDPEIVHREQHFRHPDGMMKTPPDLDPFLLLREWLRTADHIPLEEPIFKWNHFKERKVIIWERGEISRLVKRAKHNWNHSLDTKLEYVYVVVDNEQIEEGPVLAREGTLIGQRMGEVIKQQIEMFGDEGDPSQYPYAFRWVAEDTPVPMNNYKVFKAENAEFSDAVWEQLSREDFPDPTPYGEPGDGDLAKIRDAMAAAMQVDLPLDQIFSEDPEERLAVIRGDTGKRQPARASKASQARAASGGGGKPPVPKPAGAAKPATTPAAAAGANGKAVGAGPQPRRKKVEKQPDPEPPPEVDTIACDECGHQMLPTDTKCEGCGTEYEVDAEPEPESKPAPAKPVKSGAKPTPAAAKPATNKPTSGAAAKPTTAAKPARGAAKPTQKKEEPPPEDEGGGGDADAGGERTHCWSCQTELNGATTCPECGIDQGDDIPF